jgi:hypothetical protein
MIYIANCNLPWCSELNKDLITGWIIIPIRKGNKFCFQISKFNFRSGFSICNII